MCEFVVNSFPFEIIMMGTAARRAGEPFVQQFLDKHSRSCWRRPTRCALFLRLATPTRPEISWADVAFVGAALPAAPYFFASPRQHDRKFPGRTPPLLAPPSPLRLISSPRHANTVCKFPDMLAYLDTRKLKNHPRVKRGVFNDRAKPMLLALRVQRVI